jgi:replication-associated recombination protein RarA
VLDTKETLQPLLSEVLRPRQFEDLSQPQRVIDRFRKMIETRSIMNMLFYGKSGTGKTSVARILINTLGPESSIEVDGSFAKRGGFDTTRIQQFCSSVALSGGVKICFIDQADNVPINAQETLCKVIEDCSANAFSFSRLIMCPRLLPRFARG